MSYKKRANQQYNFVRRMPTLEAKVYANKWNVRSHSDPSKSYMVSLTDDGQYECSCPQWIYRRKECKHIQQIKGSLAGAIAKPSKLRRCPECGEDKKIVCDYDTGEVICANCGFIMKDGPKQLTLI